MGRASTLNPQPWTLNPQSAAVASAVAAAVAAAAAANTMTGKRFEDEYDPARPNDYSVYLVDKKKKVHRSFHLF